MAFDEIVSYIANESPFKRTLFEYYYSLGDVRSLSAVAEKYNIPLGTVKKYCWRYKWIERIQRRDQEINRILFGKSKSKKYIDQKKMLLRQVDKIYILVRKLVAKTLDAIKEDENQLKLIMSPVDMYHIASALKRLFEIRLMLMGEDKQSEKIQINIIKG